MQAKEFRIKALANGKISHKVLMADSRAALERKLKDQGLVALAVEESLKLGMRSSPKMSFSVGLFTQELISLLEAGLSLVEAIETLRDKAADESGGEVLRALVEEMYQGKTFSTALSRFPLQFSELYIATVSSAERTGHLAEALTRYNRYDARLGEVRKKIVSAVVYPAVVIAVGLAIVLFLMFYVVPKFSAIYDSMRNLPASAQLMRDWGLLVQNHGYLLFVGMVATLIALAALASSPQGQARLSALLWSIPKLAAYRRLFALTRFYRTLGLLLAGGLPVVPALGLAAPLLAVDMRRGLELAIGDVRAGQPLSAALPRQGLTTPVAARLLRVGEQSGELATMCEKIAQFCDDELDKAIALFTKLFEPVLMLFVGGLIGVIVFLLYMPIFELAGGIQ
jgi:general secretion pathway protein F